MKKILPVSVVLLTASVLHCLPLQAETLTDQAYHWIIDQNGVPRDNLNFRTGWFPHPLPFELKATAISGDFYHYKTGFENVVFAITENLGIMRFDDNQWQDVWGCWSAKDITSWNADSSYCVNGDGSVSKYDTSWGGFGWHSVIENETVEKIDAGSDGALLAITQSNNLYRYDNDQWVLIHKAGAQGLYPVDVATNGLHTYVINNHAIVGKPSLYALGLAGFSKIRSDVISVDVDRHNVIYAVEDQTHGLLIKTEKMTTLQRVADFPWPNYKVQSVGM